VKEFGVGRIPECNLFFFAHNKSGRSFWLIHGWVAREDLMVMQKTLT
jgi:hypothetical protein